MSGYNPTTTPTVPRLIVLGLVLVVCGGACRKKPTGLEIEGPILGMTVATSFDGKGVAHIAHALALVLPYGL